MSREMQKHAGMFIYPRRTSQASKRNDDAYGEKGTIVGG